MAASITKTLTTNIRFIVFLPPSSAASLPPFFTTSSASVASSIHHPLSHPPQTPHQGKQGRGIWSKMFLFLPGAITFGLGTWQIFRRHDKIKMLDYRKERLTMEPIQFIRFREEIRWWEPENAMFGDGNTREAFLEFEIFEFNCAYPHMNILVHS